MKIIGIGDLVTDYYFVNGNFSGMCGGMTAFNIIAHLASKYETYAYGVCGNDYEGKVAKKSLDVLGVNTKYVNVKDTATRCFYISIKNNSEYSVTSKKSCPLCGNKKWYDTTKLEENMPKELLGKDSIVIIDTVNKVNIKIADLVLKNKGRVFIDIGQIGNFRYLTLKELKDKLESRFEVVQLNQRVADFLVKRFEYNSYLELNEIFNAKILTITCGKAGAVFVYNNKEVRFETKSVKAEVDPSGAGDSFYSEIIKGYIENEFCVTDNMIASVYQNAANLSSCVVQVLGARGSLQHLYTKENDGECICGTVLKENSSTKRTMKKALVNISNLKGRVLRAMESEGFEQLKSVINNIESSEVSLFTGAGGSRSAAHLASRVMNELYSCTSVFLNPRDVIYRNNKDIKNIYAFSYSGTSPDIVSVVNNLNANAIIISKKKQEKIETNYINSSVNFVSYGNANYSVGRERGFLSFEGTVAPATLFAKLYYNSLHYNEKFEDFLSNRFDYWEKYYKEYFENNKKYLINVLDKKNLLDIFMGDYTTTAALDLESKLVESGVYRVELHEKKNFSHGRFISTEHYRPDLIIYFKTKNINDYEDTLQEYFKSQKYDVLNIQSDYDGLLGEFDLLLSVQFLVANISKLLNVDLSKPDYSEDAMKIYRYKGNM